MQIAKQIEEMVKGNQLGNAGDYTIRYGCFLAM
jgi:hypothetical protein